MVDLFPAIILCLIIGRQGLHGQYVACVCVRVCVRGKCAY